MLEDLVKVNRLTSHKARLLPMLNSIYACCALALAVACSKEEPPPPPPPEVQVTAAVQKDVPIYIELVGATLGSEDIEIRARVEGYLASVNFTEGAFVKKGQLLYKIDPQPFQAALAQAQANWRPLKPGWKRPITMWLGINHWPSRRR